MQAKWLAAVVLVAGLGVGFLSLPKAQVRHLDPPWFVLAESILLVPLLASLAASRLCRQFARQGREPPWTVVVVSILIGLLGILVAPIVAVVFDLPDWFVQRTSRSLVFAGLLSGGIATVVAIILVAGGREEHARRLARAAGQLTGLRHKHHQRHRKPWLSLIGSSLLVMVSTCLLMIMLSSPGGYDGTFVAPKSARPFDVPQGLSAVPPASPNDVGPQTESRWEQWKVLAPKLLNLGANAGWLMPLCVVLLLVGGTWLACTVWVWDDEVRRRLLRNSAGWARFG